MAVETFDVDSCEPLAGGRSFGTIGPYEVVRGTSRIAVDPALPGNDRIVDLDRVVDGDGLARFTTEYCLLRPSDNDGCRGLIHVVPNRGLLGAVPFSADLSAAFGADPLAVDAGDGFVLQRGWSVAWCGWQWDIQSGMGLQAPDAGIAGQIRIDIRNDQPITHAPLGDAMLIFSFARYPTVDVDDHTAVLSVRDSLLGERRIISRDKWRFARETGGEVIPDAEHVWLEGGFEPFRFYEVVYRTARAPVAGAGLLATRDFVSFLRYGSGPEINPLAGNVDRVIGLGISQCARFLRQMLIEGLNADEQNRPVFDGVFAHIGGGRTGEFNHRYAQPSVTIVPGFGNLPPFESSALLRRQRVVGHSPKIFFVNTAWEYWRGDAALVHIDHAMATDTDDAALPDVRHYAIAGVDHIGAAALMKQAMPVANRTNPIDGSRSQRALFTHLAAWIDKGALPPPSDVPRVDNGTAVTREVALQPLSALRGAHLPDLSVIHTAREIDLGPAVADGVGRWPVQLGAAYPAWVSAVDADGNETAGIRVLELAVPVATYTGWNPRRPFSGLPDVLYEFVGSVFPFARTIVERRASGDPRPSLEERYTNRDAYESKVRSAAAELVAKRYLLDDDVEPAVDRALRAYDTAIAAPGDGRFSP